VGGLDFKGRNPGKRQQGVWIYTQTCELTNAGRRVESPEGWVQYLNRKTSAEERGDLVHSGVEEKQ